MYQYVRGLLQCQGCNSYKHFFALYIQQKQGTEEVSEALQEYFAKKKADRRAEKWLKEAEEGIIEAEVVAAAAEEQDTAGKSENEEEPEPVVAEFVCEKEDGILVGGGYPPETPRFEPSMSCSIGDSLKSFKNMFASTSHSSSINVEIIDPSKSRCTASSHPKPSRLEAKQRIAALVADGWEVSADSCPHCELPLFSISNGPAITGMKCCVMCGTIGDKNREEITVDPCHSTSEQSTKEDVTSQMVAKIMEGWSIVEGKQCDACFMPTMLNPQTQLTHCIACEMHVGPTKVQTHSGMHSKLRIEVAPEPNQNIKLPDPTTSMYDLRGQHNERKPVDPTPSMQFFQSKLGSSQPMQLTMGEPTPVVKALRFKLNEPTPNMNAVRNRAGHAVCSDAPGHEIRQIQYLE